ncbi:unnamed protein product [Rotaria sp. Silwood2]|nr:unnamed protein product [Rotaria sp. Silwood2]
MLLILAQALGNLIVIESVFYFQANRISTDEGKKALFLWSVGDTTYNLLESLISSQSLTGEDTTFNDLIKLLDVHYDASKNIMTSTYDFYSCYRKPGQTFAEWKAELCEKLRHCRFTTSALNEKPKDRALRDMYVIGIKSEKIRQALLKEQDPDLEKTEKFIQLAERLEEDVRHFRNPIKMMIIHSNETKQSIKHLSTIPLKVNDYDFTFEPDTGTFITIVSMEDCSNTLKIKGECNVKVQYEDQTYTLCMIIKYDVSQPLLGLQWINTMQIDLNQLIHAQNSVQYSIRKVYTF